MSILKTKVAPLVLSIGLLTSTVGVTGASASSNFNSNNNLASTTTVEFAQSATVKDSEVENEGTLKVRASALRAGGWVLEVALKPLSKSGAEKIKKYRLQIAKGLDKVETATKSGISKAIKSTGVPEDVADDIAGLIVTFLI